MMRLLHKYVDIQKDFFIDLSKKFKDRQIIIFTCTTRELRILQNNNIEFNFIEL